MRRRLAQLAQVQSRVSRRPLQRRHQRLRRRLARAVCQRAQRRVHDVHARVGRHQVHQVAGTGGVVRMQVNRHLHGLLQLAHQGVRVHRQQQVRHVLDADGVCSHPLQFLRQVHEVLFAVYRGGRIAQRRLDPALILLHRVDGLLQVPRVVQRVENSDHVDTVFDALLAERIHHVVCVVLVAQDVLTPEQHLQPRVRQRLTQLPQALPRVLAQKAHACVERRAAPALQ